MFIFDLYKHQQPHRTQFYHNIPKKTGTFSFSEDFPTDYLSRMPTTTTGSGNFRIALDTIIPFHMSFCNTAIYHTHLCFSGKYPAANNKPTIFSDKVFL